MADKLYSQDLILKGVADGDPLNADFRYYKGLLISGRMIPGRYFKLDSSALQSIRGQVNQFKTKVYTHHRTYGTFPIGRASKSWIYNKDVHVEFYIQPGNDASLLDLVDRMDAETVDSLSISFSGGKWMCDVCNEEMKLKYDWFFAFRECENGHRPGKLYKKKKKEMRATATVKGPVKLHEFSVVNEGADPSAKITEKMQSELAAGSMDLEELHHLSGLHNFPFTNLCEQLSLDVSEDQIQSLFKGHPSCLTEASDCAGCDNCDATASAEALENVPTPHPQRRQSMSDTTQLEELQNEADALAEQVATLEAEKQELENRLEAIGSNETFEQLQQELADAQSQIEQSQIDERYVRIGKQALKLARQRCIDGYVAKCGVDFKESDPEYKEMLEDVAACMDMEELKDKGDSYWRTARRRYATKVEPESAKARSNPAIAERVRRNASLLGA